MAFLSSTMFELEIAPLLPKKTQGFSKNEIPPEFAINNSSAELKYIPLGLRWRVHPCLGLPRIPFSVWRRSRAKADPVDVQYDPARVLTFQTARGVFSFPGLSFYILKVTLSNTGTTPLKVQAMDANDNAIFGQTVQVPVGNSPTLRFQHPFMGGFVITGSFQIKLVEGVTMKKMISLKDEWELIQVVGLPAKTNEVAGYDPLSQGQVPALGDPVDNAVKRVKIAQLFYEKLPTILASGIHLPSWEIPNPTQAINELREGETPLLKRLGDMLLAVDKGNVYSQNDYFFKQSGGGIRQPEFPEKETAQSTFNLRLLPSVLLNAYTDPWFALSSGFGTTDFPWIAVSRKFLEPATYFNISHDYMVSSKFTFRYTGEVFTDPEYSEEYCALSHRSLLPPIPPASLAASVFSLNRPTRRDEPWSVEAALTWTRVNKIQVQGNAIAVSESGTNGIYLNSLRPAPVPHLPALFAPMLPGEAGDQELVNKNRFIHSQTNIPFKNSRINNYAVATMDPFGRWSDWKETQHTLSARLPEAPRLVALSLTPDKTRISGNQCPHELMFEIIWNWEDRSPKLFQLAGIFHRRRYFADGTKDNGHIPPTVYPAIFQTSNTISAGPLLQLSFASDNPAGTAPVFTALPTNTDSRVTIELLPQSVNQSGQNVDGEMRRYRVKLMDVNLIFQPDEDWYYTLFIKAAEWRNPGLFSDTVLPVAPGRPPKLTTYVPNPIPAPPPEFVPPDIIWAPLPDARGISRFRISFDRIPNATGGYAVFRAFEAKVRDKIDLFAPANTNLISRATDLRDIAMPQQRCIDAFTRVNTKLIPQTTPGTKVTYEVEIPGTIDGLMVFSVASVTREQEFSALSKPWLFVAIPKRSVPGLPLLSLKQLNGTVMLTCNFPKAPKPASVQLFRSQKEIFSKETDTMGKPVKEMAEEDWQLVEDNFRFSFTDTTTPSWLPYYYRASATGQTDRVNGLIAARSQQSNLIKMENLPTHLPKIMEAKGEQKSLQTLLVSFRSDALIESTPHGSFRFEVFTWDFNEKKFNEKPAPDIFLQEALPAEASPVKNQLYFSEKDAGGFRTLEILLDATGNKFLYKIRLADPLERVSERTVLGDIVSLVRPNLTLPKTQKLGRDLLVTFESTTPFTLPPSGHMTLEISFVNQRSGITSVLIEKPFDVIAAGTLAKLRLAAATMILRDSGGHLPAPVKYGAIFKRFYPLIDLFNTLRGVVRIKLTAPDGSEAVVVTNI